MELVRTKEEIKNSNVLFIILGVLIAPAINSVDSILIGVSKLIFSKLPLQTIGILSMSYHGLILILAIILLIHLVTSKTTSAPVINLSLKTLGIIGAAFALFILLSVLINLLIKFRVGETIDLSEIAYIDKADLTFLTIILDVLMTLRNVLLFVIFIVIIFQSKRQNRQPSIN